MARSIAVAAMVLLLGCGRSSSDDPPAPELASAEPVGPVEPVEPAACGRIVFVTELDHERHRMQIVAAAGGPITPVTTTPPELELSEFPAAITPDARSLLVLASRMQPDGITRDEFGLLDLAALPGAPQPIGPQAQLRNPSWSPDGRALVFESNAESFRDLYRLDRASGSVLRLTNDPQGNFEPAISPDGQTIAFVSSRDGNAEVYVMSADGGGPQRLTHAIGDDSAPSWSPDGQTIAFMSARDRARGIDVFVMTREGADQRPLVDDPERSKAVIVRDLAWSPDGRLLAFTQLVPQGKGGGVVIVSRETGRVVVRTNPGEGEIDEQPVWSPDGAHLAFARSHGERSDIVRVRADGSDPIVLTEGQGVHWLPRWIAEPGCPRVAPTSRPSAPSGQG
ncbi:LpqB family beta-propeller domain-containing protein [Nannocystaceae bacterium ST9]